METPLKFATKLARQTGELLLDFYQDGGYNARAKLDRSVVTEADLAADHLISFSIQDKFPDDTLLSEELQPSLPREASGAVWVVDPLDGTTNFSLGLPTWGVSIARLVNGWPELAALNFPLLGELYHVQRGQQAYLNGNPIQVKPPLPDQPAAFFSCCSRTHRRYTVRVPYKTRILGSAAYSLCTVARGIAVLGFEATPKIWDIAGAWLLVLEAGGVIESYTGSGPFPLLPGKDYSQESFPILAAATQDLVTRAREGIIPKE